MGLIRHRVGGTVDVAGLQPFFARRVERFLDAAPKGFNLKISSGHRSTARQRQIAAAQPSKVGKTIARPGYSPHEYGCAIDLNIAKGDYSSPRSVWAHTNAPRYGLNFGLLPQAVAARTGNRSRASSSVESWHAEPVEWRGASQSGMATVGGFLIHSDRIPSNFTGDYNTTVEFIGTVTQGPTLTVPLVPGMKRSLYGDSLTVGMKPYLPGVDIDASVGRSSAALGLSAITSNLMILLGVNDLATIPSSKHAKAAQVGAVWATIWTPKHPDLSRKYNAALRTAGLGTPDWASLAVTLPANVWAADGVHMTPSGYKTRAAFFKRHFGGPVTAQRSVGPVNPERYLTSDPVIARRRKAFLDMTAAAEGTAGQADDGYRTLVGFGQFRSYTAHPDIVVRLSATLSSTAAGRYQFLTKTWNQLVRQFGFRDFSPISQDQGALRLLTKAALSLVDRGDIPGAIAATNRIWASFPGSPYGQGTRTLTFMIAAWNRSLSGQGRTGEDYVGTGADGFGSGDTFSPIEDPFGIGAGIRRINDRLIAAAPGRPETDSQLVTRVFGARAAGLIRR